MASQTQTFRKIYPVGSLVTFKNRLHFVSVRDDKYGYNIYKVTNMETGIVSQAFSYNLDDADVDQQLLQDEFEQDNVTTTSASQNEDQLIQKDPHPLSPHQYKATITTQSEYINDDAGNFEVQVDFGLAAPPLPQTDQGSVNLSRPRFVTMSEDEKIKFKEEQKNMNTKRKTGYNVKTLTTFLQYRNNNRMPEEIPPQELNIILEDFFLCTRKEDGSEYEPGTLRGMMASFGRYLMEKRYAENKLTSSSFAGMRDTLSSKFNVN